MTTTPAEYRREALKRAEGYVCKDRMNTYGDAEDNFSDIAFRWRQYLRIRFGINADIQNYDVAIMMCDVKITRFATSPNHQDNSDDLIGYATCAAGSIAKAKEVDIL